MNMLLMWAGMVVWAWCSFNFVLNVLITDKSLALLRIITWLTVWLVPMVWVFLWYCKTYPGVKRVFTIKYVYLWNGFGMGQMVEVFDCDEATSNFDIYSGTHEFYIDMENIDDGLPVATGVVYQCKPVFVKDVRKIQQHWRADLIKVTIDRSGVVNATYIGKDPDVVKTEISWSVSEEQKV